MYLTFCRISRALRFTSFYIPCTILYIMYYTDTVLILAHVCTVARFLTSGLTLTQLTLSSLVSSPRACNCMYYTAQHTQT